MPAQQQAGGSRGKTWIILAAAGVVLAALVFMMTAASGVGMFSHRLTITSYFDDTTGLKTGAAVTLQGITIGTVKTITVVATPEHKLAPVQVVMKVDSKFLPSLHTDSTTSLATAGVLGDTAVDISSEFATGPPIRDGDELKTMVTPSLTTVEKTSQATVANLRSTLLRMDALVDTLQKGKGTLGKLMNDPQFVNQLNSTAGEVRELTGKLNSDDNSLGKFMNHPQPAAMADTTARINSVAADIGNGKGSVGKMLQDPTFLSNVHSAEANVNAVIADLNSGKGSAGMLVSDPAFAKKLKDTVTQTNTLLTGINQGKGTLGQLATGNAIDTNWKAFQANSNELVTGLRRNPKQFFAIRFRIF
ncbi:MAG TPA: MlaD family protein [Acidobacteriaceae bacterium]|jgi:phospholipid/cholesterol/gamma-HCH transport system substrate-binding protein